MDISLLGPVEIRDDAGRPVRLERAGHRAVLAALALQPGRLVGTGALTACLWDDPPPEKARETLATYTRAVRAALVAAGADPGVLRNRRTTGYELHVPPESVDYHRFRALVRDAARADSPPASADLYARAVGLWRGEALADVGTTWAARSAVRLRREHTEARCALVRRQLEIGAHAEAASGVSVLLAEVTPTDEIIMIGLEALARGGRHSDIDQFLTEAAERMWRLAAVRPGEAVRRRAAELTANPPAAPRPPRESHEKHGPHEDRDGERVQQTATNCGNVYFAGRDQVFILPRRR
ncbi:AfsR/SARP family transcriptional regulator [Catenuloplanes atrovinosus]|uniref:DNA-binding SARP family transcriptional activator n=1 Tax=Catenuloplanes atrovinosus TaxID=137266 RepID=A0AAE3YMI0_9ACTN|nr:bacterial transcriptional activator domain-containing protein [Catenuloplanes atrovinosus]MDR7275252.1 DNA-binding SARP family transcriptional activator [Catenuloplanes atrovinosus]